MLGVPGSLALPLLAEPLGLVTALDDSSASPSQRWRDTRPARRAQPAAPAD